MTVKSYILQDSEGVEYLMVVRTEDIDLLYTLVKRMGRMRDERLRELGRSLERDLNGRIRE